MDLEHHHALVHTERRAFLLLSGMAATLVMRNPLRKTINDLLLSRPRVPPRSGGGVLSLDDLAQWQSYLARFVQDDGRVVDTGNGGISHSEGQSYGMLFATWADDADSFARIWEWTASNLARPKDHLFAWRYRPDHYIPVDDLNDATDANLVVAWALMRAGAIWDRPDYVVQAIEIARDILVKDTHQIGSYLYLKPASGGFLHPERLVLNPSYYHFPALRGMGSLVPDARWAELEADGLEVLTRAQFGPEHLPLDWVEVSAAGDRVSPAKGWPERFSWDAIRVPLNLVWSGQFASPILQNLARFWSRKNPEHRGAWLDMPTNHRMLAPANSGFSAVAALTLQAVTMTDQNLAQYQVNTAPSYYDASLMLLARIAAQESGLSKALLEPDSTAAVRNTV